MIVEIAERARALCEQAEQILASSDACDDAVHMARKTEAFATFALTAAEHDVAVKAWRDLAHAEQCWGIVLAHVWFDTPDARRGIKNADTLRAIGSRKRAQRHAKAEANWLLWRAEAERIREQRPGLSKYALAQAVIKKRGLTYSVDTVRKRI